MTIIARYDVTGTCQDCGARFTATGNREFVFGSAHEFEQTHRQIHGREDDSGTRPRRDADAARLA